MISRVPSLLTPGMRVLCRDAEWLVTKAESLDAATGAQIVHCTGVDAMVRDHPASFLTDLDTITPLDPRDTKLIRDTSHGLQKAKLFLEAQLRSMPLTASHPDVASIGAFQPLPFQVKAVEKALRQMRPRLLLADAVGLGKTIEVGMILAELIRRGRGARILVLAKKAMLTQFQAELWNRFAIPLVRLDSTGLARLRLRIPASKNPFEVYHRIIISMDTLKDIGRYRDFLENTRWDVVVVDEAHNIAAAANPEKHLGYRLARQLSRRADSVILTTATPHNGRKETFGRLISLLDPSAIPDPHHREYAAADIAPFFLMRFKEDVRAETGGSFADRIVVPLSETSAAANEREEAAYAALAALRGGTSESDQNAILRWGLYKSFLSSPEACLSTVEKRLDALARRPDNTREIDALTVVRSALVGLTLADSTRFGLLLDQLRQIGWDGSPASPRVLLFTESRVTQHHLVHALSRTFGVKWSEAQEEQSKQVIAIIHGQMADVCLTQTVEAFGTGSTAMRLLIATDVASEGVNLHHQCWNVIHYDLPWSIITLIQRNGRIDRYGQMHQPQVRYLMVRTDAGELRGDDDLFRRLIDKVEEINRTTRSGESVLRLYDPEAETAYVAEHGLLAHDSGIFDRTPTGSENGTEAASVEALLRQASIESMDDLAALFEEMDGAASTNAVPIAAAPEGDASRIRLYSDSDYLRDGYRFLTQNATTERYEDLQETGEQILLTPPANLKRRLGVVDSGGVVFGATAIPEEAWPRDGRFHLTSSPKRVDDAIRAARALSGQWSDELLLTELHPILLWLTERLLMLLPRGEAPLIASPSLPPGELCFCFIGQVSSRAGTPLIVNAHAVVLSRGGGVEVRPLSDALHKAGLRQLADTGRRGTLTDNALAAFVSTAVSTSLEYLRACRQKRQEEVKPLLAREEERLHHWLERRRARLADIIATAPPGSRAAVTAEREHTEIESYVADRARNWKHAHFEAADLPNTRLILAIEGVR